MGKTLEERLSDLEKQMSSSNKNSKDPWDIFQIVASLLIPASIAFVGYRYSEASKQSEIASNQSIAAQQQSMAQIQVKVGQAQLISTFMDSLLSDNPKRQKLAMAAVLVALPDDGFGLVQIVSKDQSNPEAQKTALGLLDQRRSSLILNCFSDDKATRIRATTELVQGWQADDKLVPELMQTASKNLGNASGVINALVVLENVNLVALQANKEAVEPFLKSVVSAGPQTAGHVAQVRARLGGSS